MVKYSDCYTSLLLLIFIVIVSTQDTQEVVDELKSHPNLKLLLDLRNQCGRTRDGERIVGGVSALLGQYPWMARLGYSLTRGAVEPTVDDFMCGGSIINKRYILTAAHCGPEFQKADLIVIRLGEHEHKEEVEPTADCLDGVCAPPAQDYDLEKIICHSGFDEEGRKDDICLIRVDRDIEFNDYVRPVCLPLYGKVQSLAKEELLEVAGWGFTTSDTEKTSDVLMTLKVPLYDHPACVKLFANQGVNIGDAQICAGGVKGQDSCGGDSGGPLMKKTITSSDIVLYQVGIVSFGAQECAVKPIPAIYTRVDKYLKWILDNINS